MREKDLQQYLYDNPDILFPGKKVQEISKEYYVKGKRIDLLFVIDGSRYIVELKSIGIEREHIGQIVEYYGLMREYFSETNLHMILVAPDIPKWRSVYLEELGIQCVVIDKVPSNLQERKRIADKGKNVQKRMGKLGEYKKEIFENDRFMPTDICIETGNRKVALAQKYLQDSLPVIQRHFSEYVIAPYRILKRNAPNVEYDQNRKAFFQGECWWAYRFGFEEGMPPNDLPNISIIIDNYGLDVTLNAELQPSQRHLLRYIREDASRFDEIIRDLGVMLKTYQKYEHRPRYYHWILSEKLSKGEFDSKTIQRIYEHHQEMFPQERQKWIDFITSNNKTLQLGEVAHMLDRSKSLNLAMRLVYTIYSDDPVWKKSFAEQLELINDHVLRLKPLVDFFIKR